MTFNPPPSSLCCARVHSCCQRLKAVQTLHRRLRDVKSAFTATSLTAAPSTSYPGRPVLPGTQRYIGDFLTLWNADVWFGVFVTIAWSGAWLGTSRSSEGARTWLVLPKLGGRNKRFGLHTRRCNQSNLEPTTRHCRLRYTPVVRPSTG